MGSPLVKGGGLINRVKGRVRFSPHLLRLDSSMEERSFHTRVVDGSNPSLATNARGCKRAHCHLQTRNADDSDDSVCWLHGGRIGRRRGFDPLSSTNQGKVLLGTFPLWKRGFAGS